VFCKIVTKEIPADIIYEDDRFLVFLDINPVNYGHLLLISKKHYKTMYDVPDKLLGEIFIKCKELMGTLKESMNADFVVEVVVGVDVPHFHIHLVPRYFNDGLSNFWPTKKYNSKKEAGEIAERIRKRLG